jgi:hypothetical protein
VLGFQVRYPIQSQAPPLNPGLNTTPIVPDVIMQDAPTVAPAPAVYINPVPTVNPRAAPPPPPPAVQVIPAATVPPKPLVIRSDIIASDNPNMNEGNLAIFGSRIPGVDLPDVVIERGSRYYGDVQALRRQLEAGQLTEQQGYASLKGIIIKAGLQGGEAPIGRTPGTIAPVVTTTPALPLPLSAPVIQVQGSTVAPPPIKIPEKIPAPSSASANILPPIAVPSTPLSIPGIPTPRFTPNLPESTRGLIFGEYGEESSSEEELELHIEGASRKGKRPAEQQITSGEHKLRSKKEEGVRIRAPRIPKYKPGSGRISHGERRKAPIYEEEKKGAVLRRGETYKGRKARARVGQMREIGYESD